MINVGESLKVWPEWKIERVIGRGSFGTVYEAVRKEYGVENHSAIKVLSIPMDKSEIDELMVEGYTIDQTNHYFKKMVDEFIKEIQFMETLKGIPNVVSIYDYKVLKKENEVGYEIYIRMELLTPLNDYLCDKKMTEEEIAKLGSDLCTVLEICAKKRILHRDIKPENIFVNEFGIFKLGDFGVARTLNQLTGLLSQKGTYSYSAPEIIHGTDYDERADIYSLGIVLYRLLNNNRFPFMNPDKQLLTPSEKMAAVERRIRGDALEKPKNASPEMSKIILKACEYMPERRYMNAAEMKSTLTSFLNAKSQSTVVDEINDETIPATIEIPKKNSEEIDISNEISTEKPKEKNLNIPEKKKEKAVIKKDLSYSNGLSSVVVENGLDAPTNKSKKVSIIIASVIIILVIIGYFLCKTGVLQSISRNQENKVVAIPETEQSIEDTTNNIEKTSEIESETKQEEKEQNPLKELFIGNGNVLQTIDMEENKLDSAQYYQIGMELLQSRKYYEAGPYLVKAVRDSDWLKANFRPEEINDGPYIKGDPDHLGCAGIKAERALVYYASGGPELYASIIKYFEEDGYVLDHYSFATTDPENPHVLIMIDCTLDGQVSYSDLNTYAFYPANQNRKACEGIARELYRKGIDLMKEGKYKEAGQYIINAVNCKDWFLVDFQLETHCKEDYKPGDMAYEEFTVKKIIMYWKKMQDCFSSVVSEYYEEDENVLSKYLVRIYNYNTQEPCFYEYDINGNFIREVF